MATSEPNGGSEIMWDSLHPAEPEWLDLRSIPH